MDRISGNEIVVEAMAGFGVSTIFTLHGGHLDGIYQQAARAGIRLVDTRHEQAAGFAGVGWSRTTGETAVVAAPGAADIYLERIPLNRTAQPQDMEVSGHSRDGEGDRDRAHGTSRLVDRRSDRTHADLGGFEVGGEPPLANGIELGRERAVLE